MTEWNRDAMETVDADQPRTDGHRVTRLGMIGEIRTMLPKLWEQDRGELAKEIMGEIHPDNFTGVSDATVERIYRELYSALLLCAPPLPRATEWGMMAEDGSYSTHS